CESFKDSLPALGERGRGLRLCARSKSSLKEDGAETDARQMAEVSKSHRCLPRPCLQQCLPVQRILLPAVSVLRRAAASRVGAVFPAGRPFPDGRVTPYGAVNSVGSLSHRERGGARSYDLSRALSPPHPTLSPAGRGSTPSPR